jgi:hypothetical protein
LNESIVSIPSRLELILEECFARDPLRHRNQERNLFATRENPAVLQVVRGYRRIVHVILDYVLVSFLVVDWDDRAVVAKVRLHYVDVDLGEIGDKIFNSGSLCLWEYLQQQHE